MSRQSNGISRRTILQLAAGAMGAKLMPNFVFSSLLPDLVDAKEAFDHILLGTPDLDAGIRWVEERTGVRAMVGGTHPGRGTRNALVSLGPRHYLEIFALDPEQHVDNERTRELRALKEPRVIGWAVGATNLADLRPRAEAAGFKTVGPAAGSRRRPDGRLLQWQALGLETATPLVPFAIQWTADSPHPADDAPAGGTVESLRFETPQPEELRRALAALGVAGEIRQAGEPRIRVSLVTRKGHVEIS